MADHSDDPDWDPEVAARRKRLSEELALWIEARLPDFMAQLGGPVPELPVLTEFRLLMCIEDGADNDASVYYPCVGSDTPLHRQLGLIEYHRDYLLS